MKKQIILICIFIGGLIIGLVAGLLSNKSVKKLELSYETNGGVPYSWEYEIENPEIIELEKTYNTGETNEKGGKINVNYVFKGLKEGTTTITFKYVSILDNSIEKEETVKVKVDKDKNIKVVSRK